MKALVVLVILGFAFKALAAELDRDLLNAMGDDRTRWVALSRGAEAKECFRIVDNEGNSVTNANICCSFKVSAGASGLQDVYGITDTNGLCTISGMCKAYMDYCVQKEGYYCSRGKVDYMETTRVPAVIDGKWQPYGETRTVVLKRILRPHEMLGPESTWQRKIKIYDEWVGYDFERGDFLPPMGNGVASDMLVRFHRSGKMPNDWSIVMDVSFTNHPYAGAYRMKKDVWSDMKSSYFADTNAVYLTNFSFKFSQEKGRPSTSKLAEDEYIVFRTRTKVDHDGKLISARYGKLYGPWRFEDAGGSKIANVFLNMQDNDLNLEDELTLEIARRYLGR